MKRKFIKYFFSFLLVFGVFTLTNSCFCATAQKGNKVFFEKPSTWTGEKIYANLINSTTNETATTAPGYELAFQSSAFSVEGLFDLKGDLYSFTVPDTIVGTYDKISFTDQTTTSENLDFNPNALYKMGEKAFIPNTYDSKFVIALQLFVSNLKKANTDANTELIDSVNQLSVKVQQMLVDEGQASVDLMTNLFNPLHNLSNLLKKDSTSINELNKTIKDGKDAIYNGGYTQDTTEKLSTDIAKGDNMVNNEQYFENDQIKNMTTTIRNDINSLVPDTTELEKLLNDAKNIEQKKYTDETVKVLNDAITNTTAQLANKDTLTVLKIKDLTASLKNAISSLKEKEIVTETTNPPTGDILYIIIIVLAVAALAIGFTVVYSKKKKSTITK